MIPQFDMFTEEGGNILTRELHALVEENGGTVKWEQADALLGRLRNLPGTEEAYDTAVCDAVYFYLRDEKLLERN